MSSASLRFLSPAKSSAHENNTSVESDSDSDSDVIFGASSSSPGLTDSHSRRDTLLPSDIRKRKGLFSVDRPSAPLNIFNQSYNTNQASTSSLLDQSPSPSKDCFLTSPLVPLGTPISRRQENRTTRVTPTVASLSTEWSRRKATSARKEVVVEGISPNAGLRFSASPTRPRLQVFAERGIGAEMIESATERPDEDTPEIEEESLDLVGPPPNTIHELSVESLSSEELDAEDEGSTTVLELEIPQEGDDTPEYAEEAEHDVISDLLETHDEAEEDASIELDDPLIEMYNSFSSETVEQEALPSSPLPNSATEEIQVPSELYEQVNHNLPSSFNEPHLEEAEGGEGGEGGEEEEEVEETPATNDTALHSTISPLNLEGATAALQDLDVGAAEPSDVEDGAAEESFLQEALSEEIARLEEEELQALAIPLELEVEELSDEEQPESDLEESSPLAEHLVKHELDSRSLSESLSTENSALPPCFITEIPASFEASEEESDYSDDKEEGEFIVGEVTMKVSGFGVFLDVEDIEDNAEEENDITEMQGDADEETVKLQALEDHPEIDPDDEEGHGLVGAQNAEELIESDLPDSDTSTTNESDLEMSLTETEVDDIDSSIEIVETKVVVAAGLITTDLYMESRSSSAEPEFSSSSSASLSSPSESSPYVTITPQRLNEVLLSQSLAAQSDTNKPPNSPATSVSSLTPSASERSAPPTWQAPATKRQLSKYTSRAPLKARSAESMEGKELGGSVVKALVASSSRLPMSFGSSTTATIKRVSPPAKSTLLTRSIPIALTTKSVTTGKVRSPAGLPTRTSTLPRPPTSFSSSRGTPQVIAQPSTSIRQLPTVFPLPRPISAAAHSGNLSSSRESTPSTTLSQIQVGTAPSSISARPPIPRLISKSGSGPGRVVPGAVAVSKSASVRPTFPSNNSSFSRPPISSSGSNSRQPPLSSISARTIPSNTRPVPLTNSTNPRPRLPVSHSSESRVSSLLPPAPMSTTRPPLYQSQSSRPLRPVGGGDSPQKRKIVRPGEGALIKPPSRENLRPAFTNSIPQTSTASLHHPLSYSSLISSSNTTSIAPSVGTSLSRTVEAPSFPTAPVGRIYESSQQQSVLTAPAERVNTGSSSDLFPGSTRRIDQYSSSSSTSLNIDTRALNLLPQAKRPESQEPALPLRAQVAASLRPSRSRTPQPEAPSSHAPLSPVEVTSAPLPETVPIPQTTTTPSRPPPTFVPPPSLTTDELTRLTHKNSLKNKGHLTRITYEPVFIDHERPPSPSNKFRKDKEKKTKESREARAARGRTALRSSTDGSGSKLLRDELGEPAGFVEEDESAKIHFRAAGDEGEFKSPVRGAGGVKRSKSGKRKEEKGEPAKGKTVRWDKSLVYEELEPRQQGDISGIRDGIIKRVSLDPFGNSRSTLTGFAKATTLVVTKVRFKGE